MEYRGWAGAAGGIALELLQAKEYEAPLSPMQWFSYTLSFKVSWDMGMSHENMKIPEKQGWKRRVTAQLPHCAAALLGHHTLP